MKEIAEMRGATLRLTFLISNKQLH